MLRDFDNSFLSFPLVGNHSDSHLEKGVRGVVVQRDSGQAGMTSSIPRSSVGSSFCSFSKIGIIIAYTLI